MMRVLVDCRMADWSGVGRYSTGLTRALADRDDIELIQVVADRGTTPVSDALSIPAAARPFTLAGGLELGRIVRRVAPDVTHCLHFPVPRPVPQPLVVTLHDLSPLIVSGVMPSLIRRVVYRRMNVAAVRGADRLICPSANTASDVRRLLSAGERVRVVPEAADDFSSGEVGPLPSGLAGVRYVLSMGNTKPHKDLPTLLAAFSRVSPLRPDVRLVLAGEDRPGYIADVLGSDPAAAKVGFAGRTDDATLRALYGNAAVFAFPSLYEGFGLPPLEAMALGAPVVCARDTSLPEVVGDAAIMFDPGDVSALAAAVSRVLDDPGEAARLRAAGRQRAAMLTWAATAEATVGVYREVTGR